MAKNYPIAKTRAEIDKLISQCERVLRVAPTTCTETYKIRIQIAELQKKRKTCLF
jgi:hypothetical protein